MYVTPKVTSFNHDVEVHILAVTKDVSLVRCIVVGGRHVWLFGLLRTAEYVIYTYLMYNIYNLCILKTIHMLSGPPAMTKGRPPSTMIRCPSSNQDIDLNTCNIHVHIL